jgi:hypothetical protein
MSDKLTSIYLLLGKNISHPLYIKHLARSSHILSFAIPLSGFNPSRIGTQTFLVEKHVSFKLGPH